MWIAQYGITATLGSPSDPTSACMSTSHSLNLKTKKEKEREADQQIWTVRLIGLIADKAYQSCAKDRRCIGRAPKHRPRRDNACTAHVRTRFRGRSGCDPCPRRALLRLSAPAHRPSATVRKQSQPGEGFGSVRRREGEDLEGVTVPHSRNRRSDRGTRRTQCRLRRAKSPNRQSQNCSKLSHSPVPTVTIVRSRSFLSRGILGEEKRRTVTEVVFGTTVVR